MVSPEFERLPTDSLQALETALRAAQTEMLNDCRGAAITALQGVIEFINKMPAFESKSLSLPLTALMAELHDLDTGRVGKIVQPKSAPELGHRRPDASLRNVIKAYAIFAVDELHSHGSSVDEACKFVAPLLEQAGVSIGGRAAAQSWKTVRTWRSDVSRRRPNDQLRHTLEALRNEARYPLDMPIDQVKTKLARGLRETLPQLPALSG